MVLEKSVLGGVGGSACSVGQLLLSPLSLLPPPFPPHFLPFLSDMVGSEDLVRVGKRLMQSNPSLAALGDLTHVPERREVENALFSSGGVLTKKRRLFSFGRQHYCIIVPNTYSIIPALLLPWKCHNNYVGYHGDHIPNKQSQGQLQLKPMQWKCSNVADTQKAVQFKASLFQRGLAQDVVLMSSSVLQNARVQSL